jgi:hypothetical protein
MEAFTLRYLWSAVTTGGLLEPVSCTLKSFSGVMISAKNFIAEPQKPGKDNREGQ